MWRMLFIVISLIDVNYLLSWFWVHGVSNLKREKIYHLFIFLCFQVKKRNVLFIDHPVGSGFSYVTDNTLYAKTDREVGKNIIYIKTIVPLT